MRCLRKQVSLASRVHFLSCLTLQPRFGRPSLDKIHASLPSGTQIVRRDFHGTARRSSLVDLLKRLLLNRSSPESQFLQKDPTAMATSVANFDLARQVLRMSNQGQGFLTASPTDAVFVCIDCEASEWDQQKVTELGVAVLDTKDLAGTAPGQYGEEWIKEMNYAHFRPVEYAHVVNRRFVKGAEDRFAFGDRSVSLRIHSIRY